VRKSSHQLALRQEFMKISQNALIHNSYTLSEGFKGDALVLRIFRAKSSALKRSFRSSVPAIGLWGDPGLLVLSVKVSVHPL
jgi:hypothetical protein